MPTQISGDTGVSQVQSGVVQVEDLAFGGSIGFRNKIINGACQVAQRGSVALTNSSLQYGGPDRFISNINATSVTSGEIVQAVGCQTVSTNAVCMHLVSTTGTTNGAFGQRIEQKNSIQLNGKTITVSGKFYHDTGSALTITPSIHKANSVDDFSSITIVASGSGISIPSGVWTSFSSTMTLGATDASNGIVFYIVWTGLPALTNKSFFLGDVQLEIGSIATPFEQRPYGLELSLCQRYFFVDEGYCVGQAISATSALVVTRFPVTMRSSTPALVNKTLGNITNSTGGTVSVSGVSAPSTRATSAYFTVSVSSGLTAGNSTLYIGGVNIFSAEL